MAERCGGHHGHNHCHRVGEREYSARIDAQDGDWREAAKKCIRDRYGKDTQILGWEFDGDRTHSAHVFVWEPDLGGRIEVWGGAKYIEEHNRT